MSTRLRRRSGLSKPKNSTPTYAAPLTINAGGTYSGNWESTNFNTPAVTINTTQPVVIQNSRIRAKGYKIKEAVQGTDVTVRNSTLTGMNPNIAGAATEYGIYLLNPHDVVIENNHFESTPGIHIRNMIAPRDGGVLVRYNTAHNIDARQSNGAGGYTTNHDLRQFFQTDHVQGVPVEVAWNQIINEPGQSAIEDNINIYLSRGTVGVPIDIHDNYVQGAYPATVTGPGVTITDFTGGGILPGDGPATTDADAAAYVRAHHNQVLDTLNYGVAIAHGHHIEADNNRVVGDSAGVQMTGWQGVGISCQNRQPSATFHDNSLHDNQTAFYQNGSRNDEWLSALCSGEVSNTSFGSVDEAAEWTFWQNKLVSNQIALGP